MHVKVNRIVCGTSVVVVIHELCGSWRRTRKIRYDSDTLWYHITVIHILHIHDCDGRSIGEHIHSHGFAGHALVTPYIVP